MTILILQTIILYCAPTSLVYVECRKQLIKCVEASPWNAETAAVKCIKEDLAKK